MADDVLGNLVEYLNALEEETRLSCVAEVIATSGKSRRTWVETLDAVVWVFAFLREKVTENPEGGGFPQLERGPVLAWIKRREVAMTASLIDVCVRFRTDNRTKALRVLDRLDDVFALIETPMTHV